MSRISKSIEDAILKAGVEIEEIDRETAKIWNADRSEGEPPQFTGFCWHRVKRGRVVDSDKYGPFRCWSAAAVDAFRALQLRVTR